MLIRSIFWKTVLFLTSAVSICAALPSAADDVRFVPQPSLTDLNPISVKFHPTENDTIMVTNEGGRIDILDIGNWKNGLDPLKRLEFFGAAQATAFSPDGAHIVSGGDDRRLRLWDAERGTTIYVSQEIHASTVWSVAFSSDGTLIVSGDDDGIVQLWKIDEQGITAVGEPWRGHRDAVRSVAFSPDGRCIASTSDDGTVRSWNVNHCKTTGELEGHGQPFPINPDPIRSIAFSSDGKLFATGSFDRTVRFSDSETGKAASAPLIAHTMGVRIVAFDPDGDRLASGGGDGKVRLWDVRNNALIATLVGHKDWVNGVAFSPNGDYLVSSADDGTVRLWDIESGAVSAPNLQAHQGSVTSVAFSPDGKRIVSGGADEKVRLWDLESRKTLAELWSFSLNGVAFSPDGELIASGEGGGVDGAIRLWDADSLEPIAELQVPLNPVMSFGFSPDSKLVVSGHYYETVRLWDLDSHKQVNELHGHVGAVRSVAFSPDGKFVVSGGDDGTVRLWHINRNISSTDPKPLEGHKGTVSSVAYSPDGKLIVSGGIDGTVRLWDVERHKSSAVLGDHANSVLSVAFSPDGNFIATSDDNGTIHLWNIDPPRIKGRPLIGHGESAVRSVITNPDSVNSVAFSPNGKLIVSGGNDGTVRLWMVQGGMPVGRPLSGHMGHSSNSEAMFHASAFLPEKFRQRHSKGRNPKDLLPNIDTSVVWAAALSPNGQSIVSGDRYGRIQLWGVRGSTIVPEGEPLNAHENAIHSVAFTSDGSHFASAGSDGRIYLWEVAGNKVTADGQLATNHKDSWGGGVKHVAFNLDGTHIASVGFDATVQLWDLGSRKRLTSAPICIPTELYWLPRNIVVVECADRFIFLDPRLRILGQILWSKDGFVAIAPSHGIYASSPSLEATISAFDGLEESSRNLIPETMMRQVLTSDWTTWSVLRSYVKESVRLLNKIYADLGNWIYPVILSLLWTLAIVVALTMWVFTPSRLVWISMPRAGRTSPDLRISYPFNHIVGIITLFYWLGQTRRPLKSWLARNRRALGEAGFFEVQAVKDRGKYWPVGHTDAVSMFSERINRSEPTLLWIDGVGGTGKTALAMHILEIISKGHMPSRYPSVTPI